ncbi:MAG: hypothetical protein MRY74_11910, partial [Neomegalonema sp.]|nr:hypothetical protein [Neomegalonema sp.]
PISEFPLAGHMFEMLACLAAAVYLVFDRGVVSPSVGVYGLTVAAVYGAPAPRRRKIRPMQAPFGSIFTRYAATNTAWGGQTE